MAVYFRANLKDGHRIRLISSPSEVEESFDKEEERC